MSQTCPLCGAWFEAAWDFQAHVGVMHECGECRMRLSSEQERDRHINQVHRKQYALGEPLQLPGATLVDVDETDTPEADLAIPQGEEARCRWLLPFCLRIAEAGYVEAAWREVPAALRDQARYAERHFAAIAAAMQNQRYRRLMNREPKACYLAKALTLPELKPSYANQKLGRVRCIE